MKLNARLQYAQQSTNNSPVVLIHGLFGSLDNLNILGRTLVHDRTILQIDLRNHGLSPRSNEMTWATMAQDVIDTLNEYNIKKAVIIGHSMGGKVAMTLATLAPEYVDRLVIIDIAPVAYRIRRHDEIFTAIKAVTQAAVETRQQAAKIMNNYIKEDSVTRFLLKSFHNGSWQFNVPVLFNQYENIIGWQKLPPSDCPVLFICGGDSSYVNENQRETLMAQFPAARAHVIAGSGHWVHAEKPDAVLRAISRFINNLT